MSSDELRYERDTAMIAEAANLRARIRDLEAALAPFAERCREAVRPDDADTAGVTVRTGHLRRAAEALAHRLATKEQNNHG